MKTQIMSVGSCIGSGATALCCMGIPAITASLSAIGLGFLIHEGTLLPLLIVFLGLNLWATNVSSKWYGRKEAFYIAILSALLMIFGLWFSGVVMGAGIIGVFTASGLNFYFSRKCKIGCQRSTSIATVRR